MYRNRALLVALIPVALVAGCSTGTVGESATGTSSAAVEPSAPSSTTARTSTGVATGTTGPAPSGTTTKAPGPATTKAPVPSTTKAAVPTTTKAPVAGDQKGVLNRLPGTASPGCVAVGKQTDVRSGSIAVGNFVEARTNVTKGGVNGAEVNFYVIPADAGSMPGVQLKATSPTGSVRTVTSKQVEQAEQWSYYRIVLPVRGSGTWRLDFKAGKDSGCFTVVF